MSVSLYPMTVIHILHAWHFQLGNRTCFLVVPGVTDNQSVWCYMYYVTGIFNYNNRACFLGSLTTRGYGIT